MPTYLFRCVECGAEATEFCSIADLETLQPPECTQCSLKMTRQYSTHVRLDTFVDHEKKFIEWEANGELPPT